MTFQLFTAQTLPQLLGHAPSQQRIRAVTRGASLSLTTQITQSLTNYSTKAAFPTSQRKTHYFVNSGLAAARRVPCPVITANTPESGWLTMPYHWLNDEMPPLATGVPSVIAIAKAAVAYMGDQHTIIYLGNALYQSLCGTKMRTNCILMEWPTGSFRWTSEDIT